MTYPIIMYRESTSVFGPNGPTDRVMERCQALAAVAESVPYKVSMRFAFYRLWENRAHYFPKLALRPDSGKAKELAYGRCCKSFSKAVHEGYFPPNTFEDQSASSEIATSGIYENRNDWLDGISTDVIKDELNQYCSLDERQDQDHQVILVFEAAAMWRQFEHYSRGYPVDLWSLGGQASNPHKYGLACRINSLSSTYPDSEITICYFGDCDYHGNQIPETALGDVEQWANASFESYRIGVNTSPPGQWEAYSDQEAGEIITGALKHFLDNDKFKAWKKLEIESAEEVNRIVEEYVNLDGLESALEDLRNEWN